MPWFRDNALLPVDGRDDDLVDDGAGCVPGERQVPEGSVREARFEASGASARPKRRMTEKG